MHKSINNLIDIQKEIKLKFQNKQSFPKIIAVSKTFPKNEILPLIDHGHIHFGENKVQEAIDKWSNLKIDFSNIKLHMIGKLQTNKVKYAVKVFDYIHSIDSLKLAKKVSEEQKKVKKNIKIFIQINIGNEDQKGGISVNYASEFYNECKQKLELDVLGIMCIPPNINKTSVYFDQMKNLAKQINVKDISMGMSADYLEAVSYGASFVRIGSKIFGKRN
jgi:PLP dependent protein